MMNAPTEPTVPVGEVLAGLLSERGLQANAYYAGLYAVEHPGGGLRGIAFLLAGPGNGNSEITEAPSFYLYLWPAEKFEDTDLAERAAVNLQALYRRERGDNGVPVPVEAFRGTKSKETVGVYHSAYFHGDVPAYERILFQMGSGDIICRS